MGKLNPPRTV
jgi:hypothetical protein